MGIMPNLQHAQQNMLASQLLPNEVTSPAVLEAMATVKRESYVPPAMKSVAYADDNIPLGHGRVMMKPMVFARLLQLAEIKKHHHVLHIGAGTGYGSAVLAKLAARVMAIESVHELAEAARQNFHANEVDIEMFNSSLTIGYPISAPYDVIFIEGAIQHLPSGLVEQLKEGGAIVAIKTIHAQSGLGRAMLAKKIAGTMQQALSFDASLPVLAGFEKKENFVF